MAVGKVTLSPYKVTGRPQKWQVAWPNPEPGKPRLRKRFISKTDAKQFKSEKDVEILNDGREVAGLPDSWTRDAAWARKQLEHAGVTLRHVVEDYLHRHRVAQRSTGLKDAVEDYLEARENDGLAARSLGDARARLRRFYGDMPTDAKVSDVQKRDMEDWLAGLKVAAQTKRNFQRVLHTFFQWAEGRGYCQENPAALKRATTKKAKTAVRPVQIFTPGELRTVLENCPREILAFHVLGAFCGIRSAELERLDWADVDLKRGQVAVSPEQSKTASRRFVPVPEAARQWLAAVAEQSGPVTPHNAVMWLCRQFHRDLVKHHNLEWKDNGLRHSFASYSLAMHEDAPRVSLWLGQMSPSVVFRHYRERATKEDAEAYFAVVPANEPGNVVAFSERAA
ncbi:tyrosine-type recombinase/integrase [Roseimicrobium sp. ORNL1]|uniref:tyrosine-type recombinase/integrase n=1 Tax=Roseimicrobium sp. ORNL1 TaxID=2711231 RepID=UPI0013E175A1|nr:tyrosine-type recombinase/integrase [Roseimicrobium sp. ORNL1]QIF01641.1 tyrosine-type recombinase/integrase [Roseimicrobium sp. ORNL1]